MPYVTYTRRASANDYEELEFPTNEWAREYFDRSVEDLHPLEKIELWDDHQNLLDEARGKDYK